jgi:GT2 family glycosyltransferase
MDLSTQPIYAAHGSFFIFSRRFFEAGGFFDQDLFLYGEEISVAEICRSLGLPIIFVPALSLWHNEHASTGRAITRSSYERQKKALEHVNARYFSGECEPVKKVQLGSMPAHSE